MAAFGPARSFPVASQQKQGIVKVGSGMQTISRFYSPLFCRYVASIEKRGQYFFVRIYGLEIVCQKWIDARTIYKRWVSVEMSDLRIIENEV